ncbi:uracil permease [Saitoella complicata NRRL Y-17804]|nr:uracil permease [Saitoella complicata NRRL Y-17804]ODQ51306.1 uracil permease [Saitoella complicata NRRL Y-17804]
MNLPSPSLHAPHPKKPNFSLHVSQPKSAFAAGSARWTNLDLDPVPPHLRKWGLWSFVAYWISDAFNAATWEFASSILAIGLTWKDSLGIVATGFTIVSFVIAANGAIGAIYHAPFPVLARASWGFWGSYVAIISRVILAIFWFAIQTMNGANTIRVMLGAIWPSFLTLHNSIPESEGIATNTMISFVLFWLLQLPFLWMHPNNLRFLFLAKSIIVPIAWIAILIWAFKSTSGGGTLFSQSAPSVHGSAYAWGWLSSLTSVIGNYATLSVNMPDFSRYSRISWKWQIIYIPALPLVFTFISFIGIAASSAGEAKYGTLQWDPMALIAQWDSRACRFFAAFSFALAALGVNISANSLSAANDLTALFPRYVNIRRGQLLCAVLSWALVPWKILASAGNFLNFMSAYAVFLGPIAAILVSDFWIVHRGKYDSLALYNPTSRYRYTHGLNWRAITAFLVGVIPNLPGFINSINSKIHVGVGVHPYQFGWLLGFVGTFAVYVLLSLVWRAEETFMERAVLPDEIYGRGQEVELEGVPVEGEMEIRAGGEKGKWVDKFL